METDESHSAKRQVEDLMIKEFGDYLANLGGKALMGRIWGLLMASPEPMSLTEIATRLAVSKPAVSTTINSVLELEFIKKIHNPASPRESIYELNLDSMAMISVSGLKKLVLFKRRFEKIIEFLNNSGNLKQGNSELMKMYRRIEYLNNAIDIVQEEYQFFGERLKERLKNIEKG